MFILQVVLTSMHKYIPKIWIIRCDNAKNLSELFTYPASSFVFRETEFIAVTAYQVCIYIYITFAYSVLYTIYIIVLENIFSQEYK